MDATTSYILWVLIILIIMILVRVFCTMIFKKTALTESNPGIRRRVVRRIRIDPPNASPATVIDRQGNVFTISDETSANAAPHRYADFFYLEPSSEDAARIRSQLEKDDKELPSYDDVINMSSMPTSPTTTAAPTVIAIPAGDASLPPPPVPPYSEIDPRTITVAAVAARAGGDTGQCSTAAAAAAAAPSTSRAAANANATDCVVPLPHSRV